jgi:hypothetical protein
VSVVNEKHLMIIRMIQENIETIQMMCSLDRGHQRKLISKAEQSRNLKSVTNQPHKIICNVAKGGNHLLDMLKNVGKLDTNCPIISDRYEMHGRLQA